MEKLIITLLVFTPFIFSFILMTPLFSDEENILRRYSKCFSILHFIITIIALLMFNFSTPDFMLRANFNWINTLGINANLGLDAISLLMCTLTSFIFVISIFISKGMIKKNYRLYYSLMFFLQGAILGVFSTLDFFLFFLFWELELIPMYLLLLKWGSGNKEKTAMKFLLYTFFGSLFIFFAFLLIYFLNYFTTGIFTSNILEIDLYNIQSWIKNSLFILLLIGFGVKLPIFPLHSWLPDAHSQAPTPVSIILSSLLLKMGAYGILRFNLGLFEDSFIQYAHIIMLFGAINLIYASICAVAQKDIKRIIAYSGAAHMGIFLIGLASLSTIGIVGSLFELFSHALITTGLFIIAGIIYKNCGTKNLNRLQGLGIKMPRLMFLSIPIIFAAVGIPLLSGFIAEFLSFLGAFTSEIKNAQWITLIALTSIIICSVYILKIFHGIFFGEQLEKYKQVRDININQTVILFVIVMYITLLGIFPSILTDIFSLTFNFEGVF